MPFAEMDFTAGPAQNPPVDSGHYRDQPEGQRAGSSAGLGPWLPTGISAEQIQWTIQDASTSHLSGHLATVQTDFAVNGNDTSKCDFAAMAYAVP